MAFFFKARGQASPPPPPPHNDSESASAEKKWISGLVSGGAKIISTVFGSSDASDSDAEALSSDEKEDDKSHGKLEKLYQEQGLGQVEEAKTLIPAKSNSKITIEKLITKESFSREESEKLIKLIESRVVEASSPNKQQKDMCNHNLQHAPFSPVPTSPEMCSAAVAEAKKWFEEKKKNASSSSKTTDLGPCNLNTDMSQFEIESDIGSPVDLAKSYMHSKPPWQSPFLTSSSALFSTPLSGPSKFQSDVIHGTFDHSLSSSRLLKRDYISTGLWDPKEESSRRVRSRLSGSVFDSISSFIRPDSRSRLFDRDILESQKNLNSSLVEGKEPSNTDVDVPLLPAGTAKDMVNASEPTPGNNVPLECVEEQRNADITTDISVDLNKETEGIAEAVMLETSNTIVPTFSEKTNTAGQDQKILTDDQAALGGNKGAPEPENLSDPNPREGDLHITNSLHGSTNKNSTNGPAALSNMESEFESSINGEPTSSTAGPDVSDDKSLNGSGIRTGTNSLEPDTSPVRKGRKRVVSGRGRGRGRVRVRGRGT